MGGNSGASGLSNLFGGGGNQSFDPTTGAPLGNIGDPTGGTFWANPSNPGTTQDQPTQAAQNIQASSSPTATGQPSGPTTPGWVQNLSNIFLGSGAQEAGLTGGRGGATPAPQAQSTSGYTGWPTPTPGAASAANTFGGGPQPTTVNPWTETGLGFTQPGASPSGEARTATVSPQSAPVSGKTQTVSEPEAAAPAPETASAPAEADTTNYPDVAGTSRESGAGPGGAGAYNNPAFATPQGGGLPPVLQDLFTLNFGRFISDLLGQQGMPASQNQAATPPPSTDTGTDTRETGTDTGKTGTDTADAGKKQQSPMDKAAGAVSAVGEAIKPKKSPVDATGTPGAAPPAQAGAAGTATAAPTTPAGAAPGAPATGQPATGATAPATAPGAAGTNLMGTGFFDPRAAQGRPTGAPATAGAPAAPPPGGSDFAAWRDFQLRNSDPETRRMYLENQARPDTAPATTAGAPVPAGAAGASRPPAGAPGPLNQPPGGQPTPDGGRAPTNGMPGGLTPNAPPAIPPFGAIPNQKGRPFHYEGKVTFDPSLGVGDTKFTYGTGGGQFASAPYGTYGIHMGAVGSVGKSIGAWAGYSDSNNPGNNTVHDPLYKGSAGTNARAGVEIHPDVSGRQLRSNGCIAIDRGQSPQFGRTLKAASAKGPLIMTIKPNGDILIAPANASSAVAGQPGPAAGIPSNDRIDPRYGRAGVVGG